MKKDSLYKLIIGVLLVLNLLQIGFFLFGRRPPPERNHRFDPVTILHLDKKQAEQFLKISTSHHDAMVKIQDLQRSATEKYFQNSTEVELSELKRLQTEKLIITNTHFEEVKSILKPEQLRYYQDFKDKAVNIIIN